MYNTAGIINAGMWVLKQWKNSQSLKQLSMSDDYDKTQTFLYKLSKKPGLNWFQHVVLVSSNQDTYAPYDSARIQICQKAAYQEQKKGSDLYVKMAQNLLSQMKNYKSMYRIDVNFKLKQSTLDSMIGRAAHIQVIESMPFIELLVTKYSNIFCE